jgi:hypothetical protein
MSFIEMPGLADAKEPVIAPEGGNYDLCIVDAKLTDKDGKQNIRMILEIEGADDFANVFHYVSLVGPDDDEDKAKFKNLLAARFFNQFSVAMDGGIEIEQLVGCRATSCKLTQEEYEGRLSNSLQVNNLPQEG